MFRQKKSIFERLTHIINNPSREEHLSDSPEETPEEEASERENWIEENESEGQLTVDVYQTPNEIIIQTIVAGVKPEDLDVSISRGMVTIKGKREQQKAVNSEDYFFQELYWGGFSRTIVLPEEVDVEESEATQQNGLLTIRLPKIDKKKTQKLKVKTG